MSEEKNLQKKAHDFLVQTSRTFVIPISQLPSGLQETVSAAYLCMRAIDEIEDHPELPAESKSKLLLEISNLLRMGYNREKLMQILLPFEDSLPDVTLCLNDWITLCPETVVDKVLDATAEMAEGMAKWVELDWQIQNEADLNEYTYYVAGLVGTMLSDLWKWHDGTETDKELAIAFGRGLQTVNILRNKAEDAERGVNFFPDGWVFEDMLQFTEQNLKRANLYLADIQTTSIRHFCEIPLAFANATVTALKDGKEKINRETVTEIVTKIVGS